MISGIVDFVVAFFGFAWRMLFSPFILGGIILFFILFSVSSGIAFGLVFKGFIVAFLTAIILSFWLPKLRPILRMIMVPFVVIWLLVEIYKPFSPWMHETFPDLYESIVTSQKYTNLNFHKLSRFMNNGIRESRVATGPRGYIRKNGIGYDDSGVEIKGLVVQAGQQVKAMKGFKSPKEGESESMVEVIPPNKYGDFVGSKTFWIPPQNVDWEKQIVKKEEQPLVEKTAAAQQPAANYVVPKSVPDQYAPATRAAGRIPAANRKAVRTTVVPVSDWQHPNGY